MKIGIQISNVNYDKILEQALPILRKNAENSDSAAMKTVSGILKLPGDIARRMISALPDSTKEDILVYLVNNHSEKICSFLRELITSKGYELDIDSISMEK